MSRTASPIGQLALHEALAMPTPPPATQSFVSSGARRTVVEGSHTEEYYGVQSNTDGSLIGNLRFALRHEPMDFRVIHATLLAIGETALTDWVHREPTGVFSRRAWFYYETFTEKTLDTEDARTGNYVEALDSKLHFVSAGRNSARHRVCDNLLGTKNLCPVVRRTRKINDFINLGVGVEARRLSSKYSAETLARAVNYLYRKETRSSFAIEGETPTSDREERFLRALRDVPTFDPTSKQDMVRLQGQIVDPRYAAKDWRDFQNFVGETTRNFGENVHFICPRPQDVSSLMAGWMALTQRLLSSPLDAVVAAAVAAFAFVFVHPFEDGNGRIHRFLIHSVLAKEGFTPPGVIFPVSAAILRNMHLYDQTLKEFSRPIMSGIDWRVTSAGEIVVNNDTRDLYRFFDATAQVEYLYSRVVETVRVDFKEELEFLDVFDRALAAVRAIVDMPDRRANLLIRLCLQNGFRLSANKRKDFAELTDDEVRRIEQAVQSAKEEA
jgi:hypothetical protein